MSFYYTDKIDIERTNPDSETGGLNKSAAELAIPCRVETYNGMLLNKQGKEEQGNYLILIDDERLKIGDIISVKTIMGVTIPTKKSYSIKKVFYTGDCGYAQSEIYV